MENNPAFQWTKLVLDHFWLVFPLLLIAYLLLNPRILRNITTLKIGDFEVQLASIKEELHATQQATRDATQQLAEAHSQIENLIARIDTRGSVSDLRKASEPIKASAASLSGEALDRGLAGLQPGADANAIHAAAIIARKRTDPALLPALVDCLDRIAASPKLAGARLNTVWQLASAMHLTLVAIYKKGVEPAPDRALLERAHDVLQRLIAHPRVQTDRPDDPKKGVRGPAGHALRWVEFALAGGGASITPSGQ